MSEEKVKEIKLPVKFKKDLSTIKAFVKESSELTIKDVDDKAGYQAVYDAHQQAKKTKTALGKTKSELKRKVAAQVTELIEKPISAMIDALEPCIVDLQAKRDVHEEAKKKAKEAAFEAIIKPLLDAGLEDRGNGNYAIGNIILTKAQINRAEMTQLFAWEMEIEQEKVRLAEEAKVLEEAKKKQQEERDNAAPKVEIPKEEKKQRGVTEALDQPTTEKGPLSGKVEPEHGKHRSTLSHVWEIKEDIEKLIDCEGSLQDLLLIIDQKIESLQNL